MRDLQCGTFLLAQVTLHLFLMLLWNQNFAGQGKVLQQNSWDNVAECSSKWTLWKMLQTLEVTVYTCNRLPGDYDRNAYRGTRWNLAQSFGGPFHSDITWAGTGLIEGCNRRKCVLIICSLKWSAYVATYVIGFSLEEIVNIENTRI